MNNTFMDRSFSTKRKPNEEKSRFFNVELFLDYAYMLSEGAASFLRYREEKEMRNYLQY